MLTAYNMQSEKTEKFYIHFGISVKNPNGFVPGAIKEIINKFIESDDEMAVTYDPKMGNIAYCEINSPRPTNASTFIEKIRENLPEGVEILDFAETHKRRMTP